MKTLTQFIPQILSSFLPLPLPVLLPLPQYGQYEMPYALGLYEMPFFMPVGMPMVNGW